ncbi:UxaA family hydrolase [Paenibacillus sp. LHD-117]|uniref:UxaA family hydrolase n=1 Tax=Paenibacillus sp. LHD-117 TaxID=3071412 RepID=UPI0027E1243B|nr:UxaA family hydrolase [Paenibacillus sp. LHD-117]MDQ6421653.1 UxaA family hydrolase [Paenibacillus sp. LHD-117]
MESNIHAGADALTVHDRDQVATALRDLSEGDTAWIRHGETLISIKLLGHVAFGHKIAIMNIPKGSDVRKYGEVIGRATEEIEAGMHVHIHNVEGIRGRGDKTTQEEQR